MSKAEPTLSFVIPVYKKSPDVFEKCLDSLFDQSYRDFEVICVFDGPDPDLQHVASKYKTKELVIEHGGAPKARNAGFSASRGKYVSHWDADCYAKPEMAQMWMDAFERNPDAAFVYSGYEFVNEQGGFDSEQFDVYSLQCGNYIASMFPVKREFYPGWDETLKAAQDWDFWLSVVEKGGTGVFLMGRGFVTELPSKGSISYEGWNAENRENTIRAVRLKHNIADKEIAVYGMVHHLKALHVAKLLGADQLKHSGFPIKNYKLIFNIGYSNMVRFKGAAPDAIKCQYWLPWDIDCLYAIAHRVAKETIKLANEEITHQFCNDIISKKRLDELGIKAEILPLPTEIDDLETSFKDEFRVLIYADEAHKPIIKNIHLDLPYIPIDYVGSSADITKYSLLVDFHENPYASEEIKRFLLNGRNVISNAQAPFCGFMDLDVNHTDFRRELITRIRAARELPFNKEAQDYYKGLVDPAKFKDRIAALLAPRVLEVI
jgi:glycosyltransferase involved in cell wall biosynthesis